LISKESKMMHTGEVAAMPDSGAREDEMAKQRREEKESHDHPVSVNGHKLKVGDLYSSHYDRKEFISKLKLLDAGAGGKTEPDRQGPADNEEDEDTIEDQLFGQGKDKAKSSKEVD
jgi:hypothetical protein